MFKIEKNQIGCRLTDADRQIINAALENIQNETGETPETVKDALLLLAKSAMNTVQPTKEVDPINTDNTVEFTDPAYEDFKNRCFHAGISLDEPIKHLDGFGEYPTVEIATVKETDFKESQILVELTDDQLEVAKQVQSNRAKELERQGDEKESLSELFINCFFDSGNIYSFNGGWFTGIN